MSLVPGSSRSLGKRRLSFSTAMLALAFALPGVGVLQASAPNELYVGVGEGDLGVYLVDQNDRTLYFHADDIYAGRSRCHGICANQWPPLTVKDGFVVEAEEELTGPVGIISRPDGTKMATYRGRPLYYHVRDEAPGDVRGHAAGDTWFVARLDGSTPLDVDASSDPLAPVLGRTEGEEGEFLTDDAGMTLYFFAGDRIPGVSICRDGCEEAWPPLTVPAETAPTAAEGVTGVVGLTERGEPHRVTYDGRPLYRFAGDAAPGDTSGHGTNDAWFVAAVDGSLPTD